VRRDSITILGDIKGYSVTGNGVDAPKSSAKAPLLCPQAIDNKTNVSVTPK
jgi:hypothetical protein